MLSEMIEDSIEILADLLRELDARHR